jgi:DNA-binding CsgD family transcriptional regulator
MESLTFQDTQKLLQAIEELYAFGDLSSFEVKALTIIDRLIESESPIFHRNQLQSRQVSYTWLPGRAGLTPELESIPHRYWEEHPICQHMPLTLYGAYKISDFTSQKALHRLEGVYQQFMQVLGWEDMMCIFLPPTSPENWHELLQRDVVVSSMTLTRSQRNFTERDRLIFNLFRPHLFQAYKNARRFDRLQENLHQLHQDLDRLGLIILNILGQIELITSPAIQYLQTYFPNSVNPRYLPDLVWAWVRHQIAVSTQTRLPLRIEQDGKQLVINLALEPDKERYLLLLQEQTLSLPPSLELLGLSQRETEILYWVIRGQDNQAIADHLSVHVATVRKHLENIFRKLGVQSRTEAIAKALEKLGILN